MFWKLSCQETARLISEGLDHALPVHKRIFVRLHLFSCVTCQNFQRQTLALKKLLAHCGATDLLSVSGGPGLPEEARRKMKSLMET